MSCTKFFFVFKNQPHQGLHYSLSGTLNHYKGLVKVSSISGHYTSNHDPTPANTDVVPDPSHKVNHGLFFVARCRCVYKQFQPWL